MRVTRSTLIVGLAAAASACGQGGADNVMAPEANALDPAQVNLILGPEAPANSLDANSVNSIEPPEAAADAADNAATPQ